MQKAILIGNGVTSQLIDSYKDKNMISKFISEEPTLYYEINQLLEPFRKLETKDEKSIKNLLNNMGIEEHHYLRYFVYQHLQEELEFKNITAIETLLKVAHLFNHIKKFDYKKIRLLANEIYYNNGENGISAINDSIDIDKFSNFINEFDYVFTTNFDNVLDDIYHHEIQHLHGGFHYKKTKNGQTTYISKQGSVLSPSEAHLIWGRNKDEKSEQTRAGISFPISFPIAFGSSIIGSYFDNLRIKNYNDLHIWGYSGLNDGHINESIMKNKNIRNVFFYSDPKLIGDKNYENKIKSLFVDKYDDKELMVISWDEIWNKLK
ncbi:MAG: hypothetical protein PHQ89_05735 [Bacilli bacterium]|nr:hypothetical protein [Bacilli bacterium]